ncbi:MAG: hypothetical protein KC462_02960 [Cyanobacteria bacterium HKST-UBA05]|nr:hypothetical protein [Cyanobacteria bacterium HKST-UBA05]
MTPISPILPGAVFRPSLARRQPVASVGFGRLPGLGQYPSQNFCAPAVARIFVPLLGILVSEWLFGMAKGLFYGNQKNQKQPPGSGGASSGYPPGPPPAGYGGGYQQWSPPGPPPS